MPPFEANNSRDLYINPEFIKQLSRLKNSAEDELNIKFSLKKMVSDKQYRFAVLSELDSLGSDLLTELVTNLKHTPVYIQSVLPTYDGHTIVPISAKKSPLLLIFIAALFVIAVAAFVSWQNGYIDISIGKSSEMTSAQPPRITTRQSAIDNAIEVTKEDTIAPLKTLTLPSSKRLIKLRLHGSNTVGEKLAPALLKAYLRDQSVARMHWLQGGNASERELQYVQYGEVHAVQLHSHGSSTGFQDLLAGDTDISMSSRKITADEVAALKSSTGDLSTSTQEIIIGLDGVAIIVHKNNPLDDLSTATLAKIFSGEISNWRQLGGDNMAINLYARDKNSGTWDTFNSLVLKPHKRILTVNSQRFESSSELSQQVALDIAGIGFIGLPYVNNSKALAISAAENSTVIYPTRFTIGTEDYALARRLYMYMPSSNQEMAQQFSDFVTSSQGQKVVEQVGLVSLNIKLEEAYIVKNAPQIYNDYAQIASRLSVNFRFDIASNELDNKGKQDIKRLVTYLTEHRGRRIVLMGFSDSLEDNKKNVSLSLMRARKVESMLNTYGLSVTAVEGFGEKLPVASNNTALGRSKNRRVEVWVF